MNPPFTYVGVSSIHWNPVSLDILVGVLLCALLYRIQRALRSASTSLPGPPRNNWIFGFSKTLFETEDTSVLFERWSEEYGPVFRVPLALGSGRVMLCDPKAVAYFYSRLETGFLMGKQGKMFTERLFGKGLLSADGDDHKRQRKTLTPAFSNQAIRALTSVFFDSAYKLTTAWDTALEATSDGEALIEVQGWMNKVSLDTIGIAGFSHEFGTLHGQHSTVAEAFESFTRINPNGPSFASILLSLITPALPLLLKLPNRRFEAFEKLNNTVKQISDGLIARSRQEKRGERPVGGRGPKSIIETLILAEGAEGELSLSEHEVIAQILLFILAGYETTSISITWALISLCLHPNVQDSLRAELSGLSTDPTFEQLSSSFPYLDAVTKETLRLHPPLGETLRVAAVDEVVPLGTPLTTPKGEVVDRIRIAAGTQVSAPIRLLNRSKAIWGEDAHDFVPSRWLASESGIPDKAREIHGYSHLLTFIDGPRTCLGKQFAITEFKVVLSTLIRHYEFRLRDGVDTKIEKVVGILPRPRIAGEEGSRVPLLVKRVD